MPKSNENEYREVRFQLRKDQNGLHKYTFWKKMSRYMFSQGKSNARILNWACDVGAILHNFYRQPKT